MTNEAQICLPESSEYRNFRVIFCCFFNSWLGVVFRFLMFSLTLALPQVTVSLFNSNSPMLLNRTTKKKKIRPIVEWKLSQMIQKNPTQLSREQRQTGKKGLRHTSGKEYQRVRLYFDTTNQNSNSFCLFLLFH